MTSSESISTISNHSDDGNSRNRPQYKLIDISKVTVDSKTTWFYTYEASLDNLKVKATKATREAAKLEAAQKLLSILDSMKSPISKLPVENSKDVLKSYCTSQKVGIPFYKTTSVEPHRNQSHCHVLVPFDNRKEFLVVIAYGGTKELAEEEAAKTMKKRLTSLLTVPAMIVQKKNTQIEEEKIIEDNKIPSESPAKPIIQSNYYDDAEKDYQYSVKSSITPESSSSSVSSKSSVENASLNTNFGTKKKHDADVQLEKIQQLQDDHLNLMPRETANKLVQIENEKEINVPIKKTEKITEKKKVKKINAVEKKKDNSDKDSDKEISNEPRLLSQYHSTMINIFGHDSRKRYILQEISKLNFSVIEFETSHMQIINESSSNSRSNSFPFQSYINHLDSIMLHVNVGVESTTFVGHDGQFIRVIRVTTIPEIVETEIGPNADRVGVKAFYNVIERIRKLMG